MANETTIAANGAAAMTLYKLKCQEFLKANLVIAGFGSNTSIGANQGQTISEWRPDVLAAATSAFSEGVGPATATVLTGQTFTATLAQYGAYAKPSDVFEMTGRDPKLDNYRKVFQYQMKLTVDTLARNAYIANATAHYCAGLTAATFDTTAKMTAQELKKLRKKLAAKNVPTYSDGLYKAALHPDVFYDLFDEDASGSVTDIYKPQDAEALKKAVIKRAWGFLLHETAVIGTTTVNGQTAYQNIVSGDGALVNVDCSAIPMELYYVSPKVVNQANPVGTTGVLGWKITQANLWVGSDGPRAYTAYSISTDPTA